MNISKDFVTTKAGTSATCHQEMSMGYLDSSYDRS